MPALNPSTTLPALRVAIGGGAWAAPGVTGKAFGFKNIGSNHEALYMARLFGVRDIALGAGALAAKGPSSRLWWQLGVVCDLADAAAGVISFRSGGPKVPAVLSTITALAATGLGIAVLASASKASEASEASEES
jgi:hypothetical protein